MTTLRTSPSPHWPPRARLLPALPRRRRRSWWWGGGHLVDRADRQRRAPSRWCRVGAARESLVALVSTSDRGLGRQRQVRCAPYGHEHFRLQPAYAGSYLVVTAASLDRERISEYNLTLVAEDRGAPPLRAQCGPTRCAWATRTTTRRSSRGRSIRGVSAENNPPRDPLLRWPPGTRPGPQRPGHLPAAGGRGGPGWGSRGPLTSPWTQRQGPSAALRSFDYQDAFASSTCASRRATGAPLSSPAVPWCKCGCWTRTTTPRSWCTRRQPTAPWKWWSPGAQRRTRRWRRVQARDADEGANGELAFDLLQQEP